MEVILKKTIDTLGREGEVVNVKPGYARNYLIPQNLASTVNKASLARLQREQEAIEKRHAEEKKNAEKLAAQLENMTVIITRKVGREGRLFGSVTTGDIAAQLAEQGVDLDKRAIMLADAIKATGETKITVKVGYQMTTEITVQVAPEAEAEVA
ncbi:MAG: 50S ribosomal protein L9 [Candidatus Electrothrix aestuarii]|jgi:large subunit ribosomal protein L9|uniref:Large ribosomal subunit protein bL9 n=1 Tax=Candidatus Electrothrix aestuarii TaxID=3062594 RepID=A0AAU8M249_9BACT|nr:50S ribosomal protein L9 [Candidatus Electrothrix aestuarii]WPD24194.1 MAG: 50S ribosomal protein L9 [Candidatus Electrothrix sp. GW3-3]